MMNLESEVQSVVMSSLKPKANLTANRAAKLLGGLVARGFNAVDGTTNTADRKSRATGYRLYVHAVAATTNVYGRATAWGQYKQAV